MALVLLGVVGLSFGLSVWYSYRELLALEKKCMPQFAEFEPHHFERQVSFHFFGGPWHLKFVPGWTVEYCPPFFHNADGINPSLTVDLFGRVVDASSRDVIEAVENLEGRPD